MVNETCNWPCFVKLHYKEYLEKILKERIDIDKKVAVAETRKLLGVRYQEAKKGEREREREPEPVVVVKVKVKINLLLKILNY